MASLLTIGKVGRQAGVTADTIRYYERLGLLPVLARRGEWIQIALSPELRKTGMVMRWYKNENNGWIHDSMIDVVKTDGK